MFSRVYDLRLFLVSLLCVWPCWAINIELNVGFTLACVPAPPLFSINI